MLASGGPNSEGLMINTSTRWRQVDERQHQRKCPAVHHQGAVRRSIIIPVEHGGRNFEHHQAYGVLLPPDIWSTRRRHGHDDPVAEAGPSDPPTGASRGCAEVTVAAGLI